jgi:glycosyltransferase involved in cell wall biosynthesis
MYDTGTIEPSARGAHVKVPGTEATAVTRRRVRVALVISNLEFGGAQRQVIDLANSVDPQSMDVHVVSLSSYVPLANGLHDAERRLHLVEKRYKYDTTVPIRLAALLRRIGADVVHGYLFDAEIAARVGGMLARTPLVVGSERNTDYRLKRIQLAAYRMTRRLVDLVVANSRAGAEFNRRMLGQPASIYRVIHNGVDTMRFRPADPGPVRQELGLGASDPVVGMFGSFKEQKNHPLFFDAASRVARAFPSARFLLVGDQLYGGMHGSDAYQVRVMQLVDALNLRERCVFAGNRADVERLYPACDVTVLPSLFEGTPNVALESMACGVPVIATDVSDNAAIIPDGRAGYIVGLGDPDGLARRIEAVLGDRQLRTAMSLAAHAWVNEEFSTARLAHKTEQVYREGLAARDPRTYGMAV